MASNDRQPTVRGVRVDGDFDTWDFLSQEEQEQIRRAEAESRRSEPDGFLNTVPGEDELPLTREISMGNAEREGQPLMPSDGIGQTPAERIKNVLREHREEEEQK